MVSPEFDMRMEPGLGHLTAPDIEMDYYPQTGIFILDDTTAISEDNGDYFTYSELLSSASEIFTGTITDIHADENFILASKMGASYFTEISIFVL